jgi:hypothetical protein
MPNIEVSQETYDALFYNVLIKDYESVCSSIRALTSTLDLKPFQEEDLVYDIELKKAMEKLLKYYLYIEDANRIIQNQKALDLNSHSE